MAHLVIHLLTLILYFQGTLSDELLNTVNRRGSNVTLKCGNNNQGCQNTEWHKSISNSATPTTIYSRGQILNVVDRSRYSIDENSCDLTIRDLTLTDAGLFFCRFFTGTTQTQVAAHLAVLESPSNCKTNASAEDTAEGDGVMLTCEVTYNGSGSAVMSWNGKEGNRYPAQMYNLTIIRNTYNIIAKGPEVPAYECVTKLSFQGNPTANTRVASNEPVITCNTERISVSYPVRNVQLSPQQSVYSPGNLISCSAEGYPSPTVKWQKRESRNSSIWEDIPGINGIPLNISHSSDVSYRCIANNSVRKVNYNATSSEFVVHYTGEPYETVTAAKPGSASSCAAAVSIAVVASVVITLVLVLITICLCVRFFPGYIRYQKPDESSTDKIRTDAAASIAMTSKATQPTYKNRATTGNAPSSMAKPIDQGDATYAGLEHDGQGEPHAYASLREVRKAKLPGGD